MRKINKIVIHCSATHEGNNFNVDDIRRWHIQRGFNDVGYHYVILIDGTIQEGRPLYKPGAHVRGYNSNSIGICYIGGLDKNGKSKDTRTDAQKASLRYILTKLKASYPDAKIVGHRDLSPDKDGNGKIDRWEWLKDCPCFDVEPEYKDLDDE